MISTARVFAISAAFFVVVGIVYWFVSYEPAGTLMFCLWSVAFLFGSLFLRVAGARGAVAADDPRLRPQDAAGDWVGAFPAGSPWPIVLALGLTCVLAGLLYGIWLVIPGVLVTVVALLGLMRESAAR
jgi:hypothetical protein